jgi:hypothetical protein
MISILFTLLLISILLLIFWQDNKDRMVWWFLYPAAGLFAYILQAFQNGIQISFINAVINIFFCSIIISITLLYCVVIMKKKFINESMGSGDLLLLLFISFTFAPVTFIFLLTSSFVFSLLLHLCWSRKHVHRSVPLAGNISLFFAAVYFISLFAVPKFFFSC